MAESPWEFESIVGALERKYDAEGLRDSWSTERLSVANALRSIASRLPARRFLPSAPNPVLGVGGSGIVIRLKDSLFPGIDNALKFPRPVSGKVSLVSEMLSKEMSRLSTIRHPGIVRITYYSILQAVEGYGELPFYLMEAVDGTGSLKFFLQENRTEAELLSILVETAEVLYYLHSLGSTGILHLDLKPDNIVIDASGRAVLLDLGTCKQLGGKEKTTVACTRSFAHPQLVRRLASDPSDANRAKGEVERTELTPLWDLWSLAQTILAWLGVDFSDGSTSSNSAFWRFRVYARKYLLLLCARLLADGIPDWLVRRIGLGSDFLRSFPVTSAKDALDLLQRLNGSADPLSSLPELSRAQTGTLQVAPSRYVAITPRLSQVLEHRLFRRLNGVTQLGLVSQVYPDAKHSRREHSLGTYANVIILIKSLWDDPVSPLFKQLINPDDCRDVLLAALLHDLGQFPLAHDLEEIDHVFDHDDLTQAMLKGKWDKKRRGAKPIEFAALAEIFRAWGTSSDRISGLLSAKPSSTTAHPKQKLLRSLLSGPIDADKLDYLFRDARHTGLPYPQGIDVTMLFRCLTTVVIPRVDGGLREVPAIGVHSKGRVAAEFMSFARYAMFAQAYWHHAVRAQKAMLLRAVEALMAGLTTEQKLNEFLTEFVDFACGLPETLYEMGPVQVPLPETAEKKKRHLDILEQGTNLVATDAAMLAWLRQKLLDARRPEEMLIDRLLKRQLFKRLWVVTSDMDQTRWQRVIELWDPLSRPKRHKAALELEKALSRKLARPKPVTTLTPEKAREIIEARTAGEVPWLLVDIPGPRPGADTGLFCVLESPGRKLRKDERAVGDLQRSAVWDRYARDLRSTAGKIRIFVDPVLSDTVEESIGLEEGIDETVAALERSS